MRNILEIRDLQVHYGGIEAVRGISLDVPEGEIVTLIGANGAGKSSTLRAIAGLVKPSAGKISFLDEDITGMDSSLIVSKGTHSLRFGSGLPLIEQGTIASGINLFTTGFIEDFKQLHPITGIIQQRHFRTCPIGFFLQFVEKILLVPAISAMVVVEP